MNPSGYSVSFEKIRSSTGRSTPVGMCGSTPSGRGGRGTVIVAGACERVSSSATCSFSWKSLNASSASSTVMSPRRTSDSTYSLRTLRRSEIALYISGWV